MSVAGKDYKIIHENCLLYSLTPAFLEYQQNYNKAREQTRTNFIFM